MKLINGTPFPDMFEKVDEEDKEYLFQGDVISECGLLQEDPISESGLISSTPSARHLGYLIASNSCDLRRLEDKRVISLVPIYPFGYTLKNMIESATKRVIAQKNRHQKEGMDYDPESTLCSEVAGLIFSEANYARKYTFFISPLEKFDNLPSIAFIEVVRSINKVSQKRLLEHRIVSLRNPWREQLGCMMGNLYNRIATYSPEPSFIKCWWKAAYKRDYREALGRVIAQS